MILTEARFIVGTLYVVIGARTEAREAAGRAAAFGSANVEP